MQSARRLLEAFLQRHKVEFVPADLPSLKSNPQKSAEVTDHYLASLASSKGFKLATLDCGIKHAAVEMIS